MFPDISLFSSNIFFINFLPKQHIKCRKSFQMSLHDSYLIYKLRPVAESISVQLKFTDIGQERSGKYFIARSIFHGRCRGFVTCVNKKDPYAFNSEFSTTTRANYTQNVGETFLTGVTSSLSSACFQRCLVLYNFEYETFC